MDRVDSADYVTVAGKRKYTDGSAPLTPATVLASKWLNAVQEELLKVVEDAGLTPSDADVTQLRQALDVMYGRLDGENVWVENQEMQNDLTVEGDITLTGDLAFPSPRTQEFVLDASQFAADQAGVITIPATGGASFISNTTGSGFAVVITAQIHATPGATITGLEVLGDSTGGTGPGSAVLDQIYLVAQDAGTVGPTPWTATRTFVSNAASIWGVGDILAWRSIAVTPPSPDTVPESGLVTLRLRIPAPTETAETMKFYAAKLITTRSTSRLL